MSFLLLIPVVLSFLVLAAHFLRSRSIVPMCIVLIAPLLLLMPRRWTARTVQVLLVLGALEWLRTTVALVDARQTSGKPWTRMAIILGSVAVFTLLSGFMFRLPPLARRYFARTRPGFDVVVSGTSQEPGHEPRA